MRPVPLLSFSAVVAIALPLAACGGDKTAVTEASTPPPVAAASLAPDKKKVAATPADKTDIPGASSELKACLGDKGFYAAVTPPQNTRIEKKDGTAVASFLTHPSVAAAEKFAKSLTVKDPLQRGKVTAVFLGGASAGDRRALSTCFEKL